MIILFDSKVTKSKSELNIRLRRQKKLKPLIMRLLRNIKVILCCLIYNMDLW